ncbi:MAG: alpha-xylosidase [Streptosporangiales bacterium]|nr:alpha-xylosidase [Streptosporangiales bacterium]
MNRSLSLLYGYEFPPFDPVLADPVRETPDRIRRATLEERVAGGLRLRAETEAGGRLEVAVAVVAPGVVRVRTGQSGGARTYSLATVPDDPPEVELEDRDGGYLLSGPDVAVRIECEPLRLSFLRDDAVMLEQDVTGTNMPGVPTVLPLGTSRLWNGGTVFHDSFRCRPDEHFYGLGERFTDFDKRGQEVRIWMDNPHGVSNRRAYKNVPFFVSSRGYGLFVDSLGCCDFDMASRNHAAFSFVVQDRELDYYVIAGPHPATIVERYADLVGRPQLPPKWAFGLWVSGGALPDSAQQTLQRADGLRRHRIPSDVLHIDSWQPEGEFSGLDWNPSTYPDPRGFVREVHDRGFRLCLWLSPYLAVGSPRFAEARDKGYLLATSTGEPYVLGLMINYPPMGIIDLTNPAAAAWWRERLRSLLEDGADVFKTDFAEGIPPDAVAHNGMTGRELHNLYPLIYNDIASEVTREVTGRTGLVWGRSTYAGGQRHPAQWGGDPWCSWEDMASTLRGGLSIGMSGHPFWSHDMGGFKGRPTPELYVRWSQFGLLSPLSRLHGTTPRVPWEYGDEAVRVLREFAELRYRLLPYLYSQAVESVRTSSPMLRAMCFEFADDPVTQCLDLQYMLGPDLLVAPVCNEEGTATVYFPQGRWVDLWTHEVVDGPTSRRPHVPLDRMPVYVRGNALLPTTIPAHLEEEPFDPVIVDLYLLSEGSLVLHDLDGSTEVRARREGSHLDLESSGPKEHLAARLIPLGPGPEGTAPVDEVLANGVPLENVADLDPQAAGPGPSGWRTEADGTVLIRWRH